MTEVVTATVGKTAEIEVLDLKMGAALGDILGRRINASIFIVGHLGLLEEMLGRTRQALKMYGNVDKIIVAPKDKILSLEFYKMLQASIPEELSQIDGFTPNALTFLIEASKRSDYTNHLSVTQKENILIFKNEPINTYKNTHPVLLATQRMKMEAREIHRD